MGQSSDSTMKTPELFKNPVPSAEATVLLLSHSYGGGTLRAGKHDRDHHQHA